MTIKTPHFASFFLFLIAACIGRSQGFVNLDFEAANVQDLPYPSTGENVHISDGVPGWNISPTAGLDLMGHNAQPLGGAAVEILGPSWPSSQILQGNYTVALYASFMGPPEQASIFQTGEVPAGSGSILFYGTGGFSLSFAGQNIPLAAVGNGPNYTIFGGDISAYAGQTGQLVFTGNSLLSLLDNVTFSPSTIPEPSMLAEFAVGGLMIGCIAHGRTVRPRHRGLFRILRALGFGEKFRDLRLELAENAELPSGW